MAATIPVVSGHQVVRTCKGGELDVGVAVGPDAAIEAEPDPVLETDMNNPFNDRLANPDLFVAVQATVDLPAGDQSTNVVPASRQWLK